MKVALHVNQNKPASFISSFASGVASNGRPATKQGQNRRIHHCFVEKYQAMKQAHGKCTALHLYRAFLHLNSASQRPFIQSHSPARPIWRNQCPCLDISTCGTSLYYDDTVSSWVTTLLRCLFHSMTCSQINRSNVSLVTDVTSLWCHSSCLHSTLAHASSVCVPCARALCCLQHECSWLKVEGNMQASSHEVKVLYVSRCKGNAFVQ